MSAEGPRRGISIQPKYNLVFRDEYERELEPLCLEQGAGVIPYSSLGRRFPSGKYRPGADLPMTARAANVQKGYMNDRGFAILAAVAKELIGGIDLCLDTEATAELDRASAWKDAWPEPENGLHVGYTKTWRTQ